MSDQVSDEEVSDVVNPGLGLDSSLKLNWSRQELLNQQKEDSSLQELWDRVDKPAKGSEAFVVENGVLMRKNKVKVGEDYWEDRLQVVVPEGYREEILSLAHGGLFSGHLGRSKTYDKVVAEFYWPGVYTDTEKFCQTCHTCQVVGKPNQPIPPSKLQPIPVKEAFHTVQIDIVGPLPKTSQNNQYILTVMCLTTRFPEAIPLKKVTAAIVAKALIKYFTLTGLPFEIQSDRGSNFTSKLFRQVAHLLGIRQVFSTAYHPQSY